MSRMGHDDMRAALIHQRATSAADRRIADGLSGLVDDHRRGPRSHGDEQDPPATGRGVRIARGPHADRFLRNDEGPGPAGATR